MEKLPNALRLGLSLGQSCVEFSSIACRRSKCLWLIAFGRRKNRHLYFGEQPANDEILAGSFNFFRYFDFITAFKLSINDKWSNPTLGCKNRSWHRNNRCSRRNNRRWRRKNQRSRCKKHHLGVSNMSENSEVPKSIQTISSS